MNWARNIEFSAAELATPDSLTQLQEVVAGADRVRALGSGHSFNRIADTGGVLVATAGVGSIMSADPERNVVRVSGGVRYGELARYLDSVGYALHNTASLPHISVAGSVATATHGSGDANQNLAAAVRALTWSRPRVSSSPWLRGRTTTSRAPWAGWAAWASCPPWSWRSRRRSRSGSGCTRACRPTR